MAPPKIRTEDQLRERRIYRSARSHARRLNVPFLLTFEQWQAFWDEGDRRKRRGRGRGKLCLCRKGHRGAYAVGNIVCLTHEEASARKAWVRNLHPRNRPVTTPMGDFPSAALAADAHGIDRRRASELALGHRDGWAYL